MRNLSPTTQIPYLFLKRIGATLRDGKNNKNRTNFAAVEDELKECFKNYNKNVVPMQLEQLQAHVGFTQEQETTIWNLYESGKNEFAHLWEELESENGGKVIRCPICGVAFAKELDHYMPREAFPEFSAHPLNIIPLCHDCNHSKRAKWTDIDGKRMIFNAYYDVLPHRKILECQIRRMQNTLPLAEVTLCILPNPSSDEQRIVSTINELGLVDVYNKHVNDDLATEIAHVQDEYGLNAAKFADATSFWAYKKAIYGSYLANVGKYSEEKLLLYEALTSSPVFDAWIVNNI